jgi:hypothetical protein
MGLTDAEMTLQKERVQGYLDFWKHALGLGQWRINLVWFRERKRAHAEGWENCLLSINVAWQYCRAEIAVYAPAIAEIPDDWVEEAVVHELCHLLTAEMARPDPSRKQLLHEERVATQLAQTFVWLRNLTVRETKASATAPPAPPG